MASSTSIRTCASVLWKPACRGCKLVWNGSIAVGKRIFNTIRAQNISSSSPAKKSAIISGATSKRGRIFVGCEGTEKSLHHVIEAVGNKPFMFSSDFPHEVNNEYCKHEIEEIVENEHLSDDDKHGVLHRNAERFYGLKPLG